MEQKEINLKEIVMFVNATDKEFVGMWNSEQHIFAPGQSQAMELWRALHFAKHLVDRILNEMNLPTNTQVERDRIVKDIIKPLDAIKTAPAPVEEPESASVPTTPKKGKGKKEKEFPDLDQ